MSFNLSSLRLALPKPSSSRTISTTAPYPFSSTATVIPQSAPPPPKTTSLLRTLNLHLNSQSTHGKLHSTLFSRRHPDRLLPGSVLTISAYSSPPTPSNPTPSSSSFSGVLIALRRRHAGRDTSVRLRNLVGRTGVEVSYKVASPMIKEIKVVSRAQRSGAVVVDKQGRESRRKPALRAEKRAKLYFVRDQPDRELTVGDVRVSCHRLLIHPLREQAWLELAALSSRRARGSWRPRRRRVVAGAERKCYLQRRSSHQIRAVTSVRCLERR